MRSRCQRTRDQVRRGVTIHVRWIHANKPTSDVRFQPLFYVHLAVLLLSHLQRICHRVPINGVVQLGEGIAQVPQLLLVVAAEDAVSCERELRALMRESAVVTRVKEFSHAPPGFGVVTVTPHLVREATWHSRDVRLATRVIDKRCIVAVAMVTAARATVRAVVAEILAAPPTSGRHAND